MAALAAYDPGHDLAALRGSAGPRGLVELGSNENAFGPCEAALALVRASGAEAVLRYPDPHCHELKAALAGHLRVASADTIVGNGSHELLMLFAQAYAGSGDEVVYSQFGFAVYAIAASSVGATGVAVPALPPQHDTSPRGHDLEGFAAALTARTRLVYLANPNNPTGTVFPVDAFARFMKRVPAGVLVVVDEAYVEYAQHPATASVLSLRERFANLVVTRTFSKIHALAGLRIGYAVAHPGVVATLDRLRETFNINAPAQRAAIAALADCRHVETCRVRNLCQRAELTASLRGLGLQVPESHGNFVLAGFNGGPEQAAQVEQSLLGQGVVVRPMRGYGLPQCLRITVGTEPEQARLIEALRVALA